MGDQFEKRVDQISAPARQAFSVTGSDTAISPLPKALVVRVAGNLVFRAVDSEVDETWPVTVGQLIPVRVEYVRASSTAEVSAIA